MPSIARNAPIGEHLIVRSQLTGQPLTYFVPYPITQLAAQLKPSSAGTSVPSPMALWLLIPFLCRRNCRVPGFIEPAMIRAHAALMAGQLVLQSIEDLAGLAAGLDPKVRGLRQQICYAGGKTPSAAQRIYAPASDLPTLMDALLEFLQRNDLTQWDALEVAVLTEEYAVRTHPFVDGNGRWSRVLAVYAGARSGDRWSGAAAAIFSKAAWELARPLLESASNRGLAPYFETVRLFSDTLYAAAVKRGLVADIERLGFILDTAITTPASRHRLLAEFLARGTLHADVVQRGLACSQKKAAGVIDGIATSGITWVHRSGPTLSCAALHAAMNERIEQAINITQ